MKSFIILLETKERQNKWRNLILETLYLYQTMNTKEDDLNKFIDTYSKYLDEELATN